LTGAEEAWVYATPHSQRAITYLLGRCVRYTAAADALGAEGARALSTGERTRLSLVLAAATDGGRYRQPIRCPDPLCATTFLFDRAIAEFSERPAPPASGTVVCPLPAHPGLPLQGTACFRLPDGSDQEAMEALSTTVRLAGVKGDAVLVRFLDRLLVETVGEVASESAAWRSDDRKAAWQLVRDALGGPETEVDVACPGCGCCFVHRVTPLGWLRSDPKRAAARLDAEVAYISEQLGWTREQVLWLPRPRRRDYARRLGFVSDDDPESGASGYAPADSSP